MLRKKYTSSPAILAPAASYVVQVRARRARAAERARALSTRPAPARATRRLGARHQEPLGIALIITPFNYPLNQVVTPLAEAFAAGCVAVVKPSELCAAVSALLAQLLPQFCAGALVRAGGGEMGARLLTRAWGAIFFAGSNAVGRSVALAAALTGAKLTLQLGGRNPVVIDDTCNMAQAARRIMFAKTLNCGATCVAPNHAYVTRDATDAFVAALKDAVREMYGETPMKSAAYSRVVDDGTAARLWNMLEEAHGGTIVLGGQVDVAGRNVAPTVVLNPSASSRLIATEVLGPVLSVVQVESVSDALALVQAQCDAHAPLAAYLFTTNNELVDEFTRRVRSASLVVNDVGCQLYNHALPFGGVGHSGVGAVNGSAQFASAFSHERAVMTRPGGGSARGGMLESALRFPPFTKNQLWLMWQTLPRVFQVPSTY